MLAAVNMMVKFASIAYDARRIPLGRASSSPQQRRHIEEELHDLEEYVEHHKAEIEAGDHHDPTALELIGDQEPGAPECKIHDN